MRCLEDYREIVGDETISEIYKRARKMYGRRVMHINSTYYGGGVAEMLSSLLPLMNDVGLEADWRILHGSDDFFTITKKFHNALQGDPINVTEMKKKIYLQTNEDFYTYAHVNDQDCVIVHDPQPLPIIKFHQKRQPWVWRCHIDLSNPNPVLWDFLKQFILRYDLVIVSNDKYKKKDLAVEQRVIYPAIDPLAQKNVEITDKVIAKYMKKMGIPMDKPIITQISRFDKWKDPEGVFEVFKMVKEKIDCRLVMCGSMATDDPEGHVIYERLRRKASKYIDKQDVIMITGVNDISLNALQRASDVIIQKSLREGFGLTVTEAMWKSKPVVASNVGGITLQIEDGVNGFLVEPTDLKGFAKRIIRLLEDRKLAVKMGIQAKENVRRRFLITRLLQDYLDILNSLLGTMINM